MTQSSLRLVIFDVDGTLVDSQADILAAMGHAFGSAGHPMPPRAEVLSIVGLSLDVAVARLAPELDTSLHARMVDWYKEAYIALRAQAGAAHSSPLYPGALAAIEALHAQPETLLGVATGKSRRGLDKLFEAHDLGRYFVTRQVSDHHPSKPHPSMIAAALAETGVAPGDAVMIGDTSYDMDMAQAAGIAAIGVGWGYHPPATLARTAALGVIDDFSQLAPRLDLLWEKAS
ncbi:MAG: HAD-IA family hydrolase [Pseudomonadota bacterium]|uniref:HAD-IA family hydrolase n=1 Tax=Roseovarius TaxID=74030 RepID=UPI0022A797CF|nr:HAD-IA family hydrolase [Roseovarius sp. EGI FJ00037]MCZ0811472.1 HAD-IA family hydrolase [Roseovarius sp. EGI FJ00037]